MPITTALVRLVLALCIISSTGGAIQAWNSGGTSPNSLVNVACISRQYLVLGQLIGGLLAGDQDSKWEGELPNAPNSLGSFALWEGMSAWPSIWRLAPDVLFSRSLHLAAIDTKLVAVNWTPDWVIQIGHKGPGKKQKTTHLVWVSCILVMLFGTPFICHQQGSLSDVGMPPIWEKGSHFPPWTTRLGNLRDSHDLPSSHCQTRSSGFFSVSNPHRAAINVIGHTDMLGELVGSHTKVVIYPTYAIHCERLWSKPCPILGSSGCR